MTIHVAVLPNGYEYFGTPPARGMAGDQKYNYNGFAIEAVNKSGLTVKRSAGAEKVQVNIFELSSKNGTLTRVSVATYNIQPPFSNMDADEYDTKKTEILNDIPLEFRSFVEQYCWERGHSAGFEEVTAYMEELVGDLQQPIQAYAEMLKHNQFR